MSQGLLSASSSIPPLVKVALISVSDKTGLVDFARGLASLGVHLVSTGGTAQALRNAGLEIQDVADYTGVAEVFEGRVKTLNHKIHGAILWDRSSKAHADTARSMAIGRIDLVVVNLYPFQETVTSGADFQTCVENIDVGGPAMIRAAAKNHKGVAVVVDTGDYESVLDDIREQGCISSEKRCYLAARAFAHTAAYDAAIAGWLADKTDKRDKTESREIAESRFSDEISFSGHLSKKLRYGENPHQKAALYKTQSERAGVARARQLQGKALSYNNLNDADAAFEAVCEFDQPAVVIVKHANPCGVAIAEDGNLSKAYERALSCDRVSAFGGIVALNRPLDVATAQSISKVFTEVVIAPEVEAAASEVLREKKGLRLLSTGSLADPGEEGLVCKSISGGLLVQSRDNGVLLEKNLRVMTRREPSEEELRDMMFAFRVVKHLKSNGIVYARQGMTVGIGAGQMSRVDSCRIAAAKALLVVEGENMAQKSVVASDAFFPFTDGLEAAILAGARAVIQPGGSVRDEEIIAAADAADIAMVFTGVRYFRH